MRKFLLGLSTLLLTGCASFFPMPTQASDLVEKFGGVENIEKVAALESLTILSGIGGLCLLSGIILLTVSRGSMGWRPIIGGISLIALNYAISVYASWIFLPIIGATGAISFVWGWKCIQDILKIKKEK
jgi:glucan phosphoethanolaminetransferase (alkaline phosphatase superfamily)